MSAMTDRGPLSPTSLFSGCNALKGVRTLWNAGNRLDSLWYQVQNPGIGGMQQLLNCAGNESELVQMAAILALLAERSLRALRCSQRIRYSLCNMRHYWEIPLASFPPFGDLTHREMGPLECLRQKMALIARICWLLIKDAFELAMVLLDMREALTWDKTKRGELAKHMIVDIARLCDSVRYSRQELRGSQEKLNRHLRRIAAPFKAEQLIALFDHIDQLDRQMRDLQRTSAVLS